MVTGADSGIGLTTARLLHAEGARVVLSDRKQNTVDRAVEGLGDGDRLALLYSGQASFVVGVNLGVDHGSVAQI